MKWLYCLLVATLPWLTGAAGLPDPVLPSGVGVNIHFVTGHEKDLDLIAAAGFKFIRMDFGWASTERKKGEYDWSGYDELLNNLEKRGVRALFILDYSSPLYEETVTSQNPINGQQHKTTASPQHPESVAAFARWAGAAAKHYRGRNVLWEIWNEPNIHFWSPKPDVEQYTRLALATVKAVREADPQATVIGPATSGFPWDFLETFFKSGILQDLDAVSVHPYRDYKQSPETAVSDYRRLRSLIDQYAPPSKTGKIPMVSGEWGYATHRGGVSPETQAAFAVRQQLSNLLNGIPLSIWYDWKNDGPDAEEREHNFGTVSETLQPKPAYDAMRVFTRELNGCHITERLPVESDKDFVLLLTDTNGSRKLAAWTTAEAHSIRLKLDAKGHAKRAVDGLGKTLPVVLEEGKLKLDLNPLPRYVSLAD